MNETQLMASSVVWLIHIMVMLMVNTACVIGFCYNIFVRRPQIYNHLRLDDKYSTQLLFALYVLLG